MTGGWMTGGGWVTGRCWGAHPAASNIPATISDRNFILRSLAALKISPIISATQGHCRKKQKYEEVRVFHRHPPVVVGTLDCDGPSIASITSENEICSGERARV
jgi:hypothetical protein